MLVFLKEILDSGFRSVSLIGMGKNTGKTFTFNQLIMEARQLDIGVAMTTIGLDGEPSDSLFHHAKPKILLSPGQIVANARSLLLASGLDYEILQATGVTTPLGEVFLARALSAGETLLAGPGTRQELALVKDQLEGLGVDLFIVDGAVDRRSLAAPMVTDTTVLAAGAEASWDRRRLLEKLRHQLRILQLPAWQNQAQADLIQHEYGLSKDPDVKLVLLGEKGVQAVLTNQEFYHTETLPELIDLSTRAVFVRGMLTDSVLARVLAGAHQLSSINILVQDPTAVFLGPQSFHSLDAYQSALQVLDSIHISAVTVNPFSSRYGLADPLQLLRDVGCTVDPIPAFDLNLGMRYRPEEEDFNGIS